MTMVEIVARTLCKRKGYDPDALEPGDMAMQPDWDESRFRGGEYDSEAVPDGTMTNGEPGHFMWRHFIFDAQAVISALDNGR